MFTLSPDAGKDCRQEEKGTTEDAMIGWHHRLNWHEFEQSLGDGEGQGHLARYSPWGCKESDRTEWLNNSNNSLFCSVASNKEVKFAEANREREFYWHTSLSPEVVLAWCMVWSISSNKMIRTWFLLLFVGFGLVDIFSSCRLFPLTDKIAAEAPAYDLGFCGQEHGFCG